LKKWAVDPVAIKLGGFISIIKYNDFEFAIDKAISLVDRAILQWKDQFVIDESIGSTMLQCEIKSSIRLVDSVRDLILSIVSFMIHESSLWGVAASKRCRITSYASLISSRKFDSLINFNESAHNLLATNEKSIEQLVKSVQQMQIFSRLVSEILGMEGIAIEFQGTNSNGVTNLDCIYSIVPKKKTRLDAENSLLDVSPPPYRNE
jgi:hypothetical protein